MPDGGAGVEAGDGTGGAESVSPDGGGSGSLFREDFQDGDFTAGPAGAVMQNCNPPRCGAMLAVVVDDPAPNKALRVAREGAPAERASMLVAYRSLGSPVPYGKLHLRYRVKLVVDEVPDGGSDCFGWAAEVRAALGLANGSSITAHGVHSTGASRCLPAGDIWLHRAVPLGQWIDVDLDLEQEFVKRRLPVATAIKEVVVGSSGLNFEARFDDVELYLAP